MLLLTRKKGESVMIGEDIKLTIAGVHGNQVKISIEAPREIPVHRQEIYELIQEEKRGKKTDYSGKTIITIRPVKTH